jgi:hypothetical protein
MSSTDGSRPLGEPDAPSVAESALDEEPAPDEEPSPDDGGVCGGVGGGGEGGGGGGGGDGGGDGAGDSGGNFGGVSDVVGRRPLGAPYTAYVSAQTPPTRKNARAALGVESDGGDANDGGGDSGSGGNGGGGVDGRESSEDVRGSAAGRA